jgi:hypothetical protein
MLEDVNAPIRVQKALDAEVNIGPIPGSQIWWWAGAMIITVLFCKLINRGWPVGFPLFVWMAATSWILTGKQSWKFLNRFCKPTRYVFAGLTYTPFLQISHANQAQE